MSAEIVTITDNESGSSAQLLVSQGFNCFSWQPVLNDGPREMLWSHPEFTAGKQRPSGSGTPLLFPFPGRIGKARYEFEGTTYELPPGDAHGNALHGFVFNRPWRITHQCGHCVSAEFQASVDAPETLSSWPSDYLIEVRYKITGQQLKMKAEYTNKGTDNLPCAFGTHAYFRIPLSDAGSAADTVIRAPVDREWQMHDMLPAGAPTPLDNDTPLASGLTLASREFDTVYQVAAKDLSGDSPVVTEVHDPVTGRTLRQTSDSSFGCCVIYTPPHREAVCLEPYSCTPDPFRLESEGHATGLQILAPQESHQAEVLLEIV